jgi:hypothetical protein
MVVTVSHTVNDPQEFFKELEEALKRLRVER